MGSYYNTMQYYAFFGIYAIAVLSITSVFVAHPVIAISKIIHAIKSVTIATVFIKTLMALMSNASKISIKTTDYMIY